MHASKVSDCKWRLQLENERAEIHQDVACPGWSEGLVGTRVHWDRVLFERSICSLEILDIAQNQTLKLVTDSIVRYLGFEGLFSLQGLANLEKHLMTRCSSGRLDLQ